MAIAPPHGLTRGSSSAMPKWSRKASTCTANASFSSNRPMSSMLRPAMRSAFSVDGIGPTPITSGSTPTKPNDTRRMPTGRPSSRAVSSATSSAAVAPSFRPAALPAVTLPCGRNGVFRPASFSIEVSRGASSTLARPQPASGSRTATGTRSPWSLPLAYAFAVFCCDASANASVRSLVMCGTRSCRFSAVEPITRADGSTSFSATMRGLGSTPSPIGWRPMCSTPPAMATSYAPMAMPLATVVTAVIAPAHIRSMAKPGTVLGRPASRAAVRPMVRPWSPIWVVAAMATSSTFSGGSCGLRRISSRMQRITRSSARVLAYIPPALPNGVRTPSTKTTSRTSRGTWSLPRHGHFPGCYSPVTKRGTTPRVAHLTPATDVTAGGCAAPR